MTMPSSGARPGLDWPFLPQMPLERVEILRQLIDGEAVVTDDAGQVVSQGWGIFGVIGMATSPDAIGR
jgi:hypothetical protein